MLLMQALALSVYDPHSPLRAITPGLDAIMWHLKFDVSASFCTCYMQEHQVKRSAMSTTGCPPFIAHEVSSSIAAKL